MQWCITMRARNIRELYPSNRPLIKTACDVFETIFQANHFFSCLHSSVQSSHNFGREGEEVQGTRGRRLSSCRGGHAVLSADETALDCDGEAFERLETRVGRL